MGGTEERDRRRVRGGAGRAASAVRVARGALAAWAMALACPPGMAAADLKPGAGPDVQAPSLTRSSRMIGMAVRDLDGRKVGDLRDIVLDARRGEIAYAVINFGGVLGVGAKYHAVPWQALKRSENGRWLILAAERDAIANAPSFDRGRWPDMSRPAWAAAIDAYWRDVVAGAGARPAPGGSAGQSGGQGGK
ncbi:PRC-barrel domain-containing protein [Noviherbaspirillum galbum]|uniref:PRC-barrel domain containing protein n=1 Tax=Noviherbaspirillum galbum TaxID=2709383 RepID=A0A6B3SRV1_9BURK|nr:PRC-barrel domain-containing protein [Noviherbaspirillum galbum]NEX60379.1 PRC-barrel domain containing protein [Noviherbaspirillum galbum]